MKLLQINNNHRIVGGSDIMYLNTGALLEQAGHEVRYFAARSSSDLKSQDDMFFPEGIDTAAAGAKDILRYFYNAGARKSMNTLLDEHSYIDVAHLHIYYGRLTPAILPPLRRRGIPIVQSLHEYKLACPVYTLESHGAVCEACVRGSTLNCLRKRCKDGSMVKSSMLWMEYHSSRLQGDVRLIDKFICVSHFQRNMLARAGIPDEKMTTLHNFVNPDVLQPIKSVVREDYLFYFGRIETLKGLSTLIEASELTGATLKIAGTGSWSDELRMRIAKMPNVDYLGFVSGEPLRRLVAQAKAVVVPSEWYETFGLTALEAKAVGTPVIASDIGGLPEIVQHGRDGLLFTPGDVKALAAAIAELDNHDLEALGALGRQDAIDRFSPSAYLNRLLNIYSELQVG